jgi:hypothetical protein
MVKKIFLRKISRSVGYPYMHKVLGVVASMRYDSGPRIITRVMTRTMMCVMTRVITLRHDVCHDARHDDASLRAS